MVFHTSAHQPLDTKPGNKMVGRHLNRNITWAENAKPLFTYFARQSYMLQQGQFVADLAYLLNEGAPSTPAIWGTGTTPFPPAGHDFDYVNTDALLNLMSVDKDGNLILPSGMTYKLLVLPESTRMRPELLRKLRDLVRGGQRSLALGRPGRRASQITRMRTRKCAHWPTTFGVTSMASVARFTMSATAWSSRGAPSKRPWI